MVTATHGGRPAVIPAGNPPSARTNTSSSSSASSTVRIAKEAALSPSETMIVTVESPVGSCGLVSSGSMVPGVTVTGMCSASANAAPETLAVTVTAEPSRTGFGDTDSDTVRPSRPAGGASSSVITTMVVPTAPTLTLPEMTDSFSATVSTGSASSSPLMMRVHVVLRAPAAAAQRDADSKSAPLAVPPLGATRNSTSPVRAGEKLILSARPQSASVSVTEYVARAHCATAAARVTFTV